MKTMSGAKNNGWRDGFNPLRGMGMARMVALLEAGERGQFSDLQWFYHYMERSDAMIHAVMQRRRSAFMGCDWDIRLAAEVSGFGVQGSGKKDDGRRKAGPTPDEVLAEEQAAFLREAYDRVENFRDAVAFLFTGFFRGFGHLEKHFSASGLVTRLEPVEQWFWVRDGLFGAWEYNPDAVSGRQRGLPIEPESFVVFESAPLNRILALAYLRKTLNERDWDSYLEVFGIPSTFLVGPPNTSAAKEAEYQAIAEAIISDGRGYLPNGTDVKYVNAYGAKPPFLDRIEYLDRQITLAATGGLLTMLAEPGSGTLAGNAHSDTFLQIARSDAAILSGIFQEQFDTPLLREFFPGQPILAYFEFAPPAADEVSRVVRDAVELAKAGVRIDLDELSEKTGYRLERMSDPPPRKASASAKATADMPA
jgi:phage gp29-like protein